MNGCTITDEWSCRGMRSIIHEKDLISKEKKWLFDVEKM